MANSPSKRPGPRRKGTKKTLPDGSTAVAAPTTTISRVGPPLTQAVREPTPITAVGSGDEIDMGDNTATAAPAPTTSTTPGGAPGLTHAEMAAIIKMQRRTTERLKFESLRKKTRQESAYPLSQPVLPSGSEYRIPCTRLLLGLQYYPDARRDVNRFIWHEIQSLARAVVASAKLRGTAHGPLNDELKWKKLDGDIQTDLRNELKDLLVSDVLFREVLYADGNMDTPKFYENWPLDRLIITAMTTERTAARNKVTTMLKLQASLAKLRGEHQGRPGWIGKEIRYVKKVQGRKAGRPRVVDDVCEEDSIAAADEDDNAGGNEQGDGNESDLTDIGE